MTDSATLQTWLAEAEAALHALATGRREMTISYDGKSVTYTQATMGALRAHVASLKRQLGQTSRPPARRLYFG